MREIPECLNRRYQALDELIRELSSLSNFGSEEDYANEPGNEPGIKLMCDFWNILKEDPDCNLTQAVRQRMGLSAKASGRFKPQHVTCYMAYNSDDNRKKKSDNKTPEPKTPEQKSPDPRSPEPRGTCCSSKSVSPKSTSEAIPLSKVLCNLKEAVSFDKRCNVRIGELMLAEKQLQEQIQHLEHREKEGIKMLKQADCMWSCMEEAYKKKVAESVERQNILLKQIKEVEISNAKWRKNKKDLEFQLSNINKCYQEITEKIHEKTNDVKCIKTEVENFKKRIESNKKDTDAVKQSFGNKKTASDAKVASLSAEMTQLKEAIDKENQYKQEKEEEGNRYIKDAREDLQKICKVLLQKKLENEDLKAEKEALLEEIELLKKTCDQCREKCQNKQKTIIDEIAKVDSEIAGFKVRCIRCHECTDTRDVRMFCTDCPRCAEERDCLYEDGHCVPDTEMDCVCMSTKQKFLDNVFENMYTVLERQAKTCPGKAVADQVLNCLKKSRNGKLNDETRQILQDFVLTTVKKNLNLTIIGGAVKTRCEMDPETYKQLMLCLDKVKTQKAPKVDKGTAAKKDPCRRWGGANECNCPKGPKACICTKKAPPPPNEPEPCPEERDPEDAGEVMVCPHKESAACGPDCAMHAASSAVGTEVASWRPAPCDDKQCSQFSKNMRAAQCVLGPDSLSSVSKSKGYIAAAPLMPNISELEDMIICKCGQEAKKPCVCRKEIKSHPREKIIEEVMGRYTDVTPIEKVSFAILSDESIDIVQRK
ncbi:hypothetical protein ABMA27_002803 [Loxostege sticticalis]|uniref:Uncharacterized protein n=1 Tax=Loxostege sticticalis TaxID=481309 RepID=A0ABR3HUX3_LOXSC